jgi:hypothetical protein
MAETDLNLAGDLNDKFAVGFGGSAGFVGNITDAWKVGLTLSGFCYSVFMEHTRLQAVLSQNIQVSRNNSIAMSLKGELDFFQKIISSLPWMVYYHHSLWHLNAAYSLFEGVEKCGFS